MNSTVGVPISHWHSDPLTGCSWKCYYSVVTGPYDGTCCSGPVSDYVYTTPTFDSSLNCSWWSQPLAPSLQTPAQVVWSEEDKARLAKLSNKVLQRQYVESSGDIKSKMKRGMGEDSAVSIVASSYFVWSTFSYICESLSAFHL